MVPCQAPWWLISGLRYAPASGVITPQHHRALALRPTTGHRCARGQSGSSGGPDPGTTLQLPSIELQGKIRRKLSLVMTSPLRVFVHSIARCIQMATLTVKWTPRFSPRMVSEPGVHGSCHDVVLSSCLVQVVPTLPTLTQILTYARNKGIMVSHG